MPRSSCPVGLKPAQRLAFSRRESPVLNATGPADDCGRADASLPEQVGERVNRVIASVRAAQGDVALFAHGHVLRVLAARWIGQPAGAGQYFLLDTGTLCVLGFYRDVPAVRVWNGPLTE